MASWVTICDTCKGESWSAEAGLPTAALRMPLDVLGLSPLGDLDGDGIEDLALTLGDPNFGQPAWAICPEPLNLEQRSQSSELARTVEIW